METINRMVSILTHLDEKFIKLAPGRFRQLHNRYSMEFTAHKGHVYEAGTGQAVVV